MSKAITMYSRLSHRLWRVWNPQSSPRFLSAQTHYPFSKTYDPRRPFAPQLLNHIDAKLFHLLDDSYGVLLLAMFPKHGLRPRTSLRSAFTPHHLRWVTPEGIPRVAEIRMFSITRSHDRTSR